jgi:glycosyltransferase involved in cell wall biosynthesis
MSDAQITVCIPAFNQPQLLHEALSSLCDQGLRREEYVVAVSDDASPTSLRDTVSAFEDRLQIVYQRAEHNIGHLANFERSTTLTATPYLSFLPHDDLVAPGQLGRALTAVKQRPGTVLVASLVLTQRFPGAPFTHLHGLFLRGGSKASYSEVYEWDTAEWMALGLVTTPLSIVGSLFHAETFRRCDNWKRFPLWHDRLMMAEMGFHGGVISLPWIGGYYRESANQLSGQLWANHSAEFLEVSALLTARCEAEGIPVLAFWVDQICQATPDERILYLQMIKRAATAAVFQQIKQESEARLQTRLHLGGRLDRLAVPAPVAEFVRGVDRFIRSRRP